MQRSSKFGPKVEVDEFQPTSARVKVSALGETMRNVWAGFGWVGTCMRDVFHVPSMPYHILYRRPSIHAGPCHPTLAKI